MYCVQYLQLRDVLCTVLTIEGMYCVQYLQLRGCIVHMQCSVLLTIEEKEQLVILM